MDEFLELEETRRLQTQEPARVRDPSETPQRNVGVVEMSESTQSGDEPSTTTLDPYLLTQLKGCLSRLQMPESTQDMIDHNQIKNDEDLQRVIDRLVIVMARKVLCEEILLAGKIDDDNNKFAVFLGSNLDIPLSDIAITTREEWKELYEIEMKPHVVRRLAAYHHWLINGDPFHSHDKRTAGMSRELFDTYMLSEWRVPKAPPSSQASAKPPIPAATSSVPGPLTYAGVTQSKGAQVAMAPPQGPKSRRSTLLSRRQSQIGAGSGLTPARHVTFAPGTTPSAGANPKPTPVPTSKSTGLSGPPSGYTQHGTTATGQPIYIQVPTTTSMKSKADELQSGRMEQVAACFDRHGLRSQDGESLGCELRP